MGLHSLRRSHLGLRRVLGLDAESEVSKAARVLKLATGNWEKTVYNLPVGMRDAPVSGCVFIKFENGTSRLHLPGSRRPTFEQV